MDTLCKTTIGPLTVPPDVMAWNVAPIIGDHVLLRVPNMVQFPDAVCELQIHTAQPTLKIRQGLLSELVPDHPLDFDQQTSLEWTHYIPYMDPIITFERIRMLMWHERNFGLNTIATINTNELVLRELYALFTIRPTTPETWPKVTSPKIDLAEQVLEGALSKLEFVPMLEHEEPDEYEELHHQSKKRRATHQADTD